ncbi:MAG: hypothetical protein ACREO8_12125 [Luteimonas sp.]
MATTASRSADARVLIGIRFSELSTRSKSLLGVATLLLAAGAVAHWTRAASTAWTLTLWLLTVLVLGVYWLSFLVDFRGRLTRPQIVLATAFALLPWLLVLGIVIGFLMLTAQHATLAG